MIGKIFNRKNTDKLLDAGIKGIDKLFTTKEEKLDHLQKVADGHTDFINKQMGASTTSSKARRVIAFLIVGLWVYYGLSYSLLIFLGHDHIADKFYRFLSDDLTTVNLMVVAFYFGNYILNRSGVLNLINKTKKKEK